MLLPNKSNVVAAGRARPGARQPVRAGPQEVSKPDRSDDREEAHEDF